jgi:molybdenum cofactor cytidylyltransferase
MIPGIILAAGQSSRMGRAKALLPMSPNETFLERVASTLLEGGVDDVIVVVGADAAAIGDAVVRRGLSVRLVENQDWAKGQLTSLNCAIRAIDRPGVRAAMVTLIDVPLVRVSTVRLLLNEYRRGSALVVRPERNGKHGHPVIFDRALFDEFRRANPERGAKEVIRAYSAEQLNVDVEDEGAFIDIDTPADYERWIGRQAT